MGEFMMSEMQIKKQTESNPQRSRTEGYTQSKGATFTLTLSFNSKR